MSKSAMESVKKANQRFRRYPALLAKCSEAAATYAACVTRDLNVTHKFCEKEYQQFIKCIQKAAMEMNTRL